MTKRNRKTLSSYFTNGALPKEENFSDLIESMVNIVDDGFDKSPQNGMKIAQLESSSKLISFYEEITVKAPVWSIAFSAQKQSAQTGGGQNLNFYLGQQNASGMTLAAGPARDSGNGDNTETREIRVGINNESPRQALDVNGVIAANGRIGREGKIRADGEWHPILSKLDGCQAFEVTAGVGKPSSGRYALMHAFAVNVFNSKKANITYHQAHYLSKCDQIDLRWVGDMHDYALEMRTRCSYEDQKKNGKDSQKDDKDHPRKAKEIYVRYYLTQLWFDPFMAGSTDSADAD
jgi:hypothetical protein